MTRSIASALQPRRRISSAVLGMANGTLSPQSQAEFIHSRSLPCRSRMSTARAGVHFEMG